MQGPDARTPRQSVSRDFGLRSGGKQQEETVPIAIKFENVSKSYSDRTFLAGGLKNYALNGFSATKYRKSHLVLSNISFEIRRGTTVAFVGRNGAGKSTLLGLIAGIMRPDSGDITVDGRVSSLLELGAGFHPDLSGRENIELYGVVLGFSRAEVRRRVDSIIAFRSLQNISKRRSASIQAGCWRVWALRWFRSSIPKSCLSTKCWRLATLPFRQSVTTSFGNSAHPAAPSSWYPMPRTTLSSFAMRHS